MTKANLSSEKTVLFLAPQLPWPLDTGGKIRTFHLLRALCKKFPVHLLALRPRLEQVAGQSEIEALGAHVEILPPPQIVEKVAQMAWGIWGPYPLNVRKYQQTAVKQRVVEICQQKRIGLIHCDHLHLAPYGAASGQCFAIDEHNVETLIWQRLSQDPQQPWLKRLIYAQQTQLLKQSEMKLCRNASLVLFCSPNDQQIMRQMCGQDLSSTIIPNGVDVQYFSAAGPQEGSSHLVFVGSMDWLPNEQAVLAFLDDIWPAVRKNFPELKFVIVGRNPRPAVCERAGQENVSVTGSVRDVRPYLRGALALCVPMRVGGGTRLKILEAFAARVPVISTAIGIEGIKANPGEHYCLAETAEDFSRQIAWLTSNEASAKQMSAKAFALVNEEYSWEGVGQKLAMQYQEKFFS